jgi:hypothetical protein
LKDRAQLGDPSRPACRALRVGREQLFHLANSAFDHDVSCGNHPGPALIFAAKLILAKSSFRVLFRPSQGVVQERAEVGLDDLEFARCHRDGLWKVVDDLGAIDMTTEGRIGRTNWDFRPRRGLASARPQEPATAGRRMTRSVRAPRESGFRLIKQANLP